MPADSGKACEVAVIGVDDSAVLDGDRGQGGVGDDVSAEACTLRELLKDLPVSIAGVEDLDVGRLEPGVYDFCSLGESDGFRRNPYVCCKP